MFRLMSRQVNLYDAKTELSRLVNDATKLQHGKPTVGAVCDRPYYKKDARSQTAPTVDSANSADFCHGLLEQLAEHRSDEARATSAIACQRSFRCFAFQNLLSAFKFDGSNPPIARMHRW